MNEIVKYVATAHSQTEFFWDWPIPVYLFLGGTVAGLMVLTSFRYIAGRDNAPILLTAGMLALWLDLSNRFIAYRFYLAFKPLAPMSWGAWILLGVYPVSILFSLSELPEKWRRKIGGIPLGTRITALADWVRSGKIKARLAWANMILGVGLGIYTGILLGNLLARPLWNSAILGPLFLASGLSTGAALMLLFGLNREERHLLGRADTVFILLELVLLGLFLISLLNGNAVRQESAALLFGGEYTAAFWSLVVIAGLLVPLFAEFWEILGGKSSRWMAPVLVLFGGLSLRWILVFAGQISSW